MKNFLSFLLMGITFVFGITVYAAEIPILQKLWYNKQTIVYEGE